MVVPLILRVPLAVHIEPIMVAFFVRVRPRINIVLTIVNYEVIAPPGLERAAAFVLRVPLGITVTIMPFFLHMLLAHRMDTFFLHMNHIELNPINIIVVKISGSTATRPPLRVGFGQVGHRAIAPSGSRLRVTRGAGRRWPWQFPADQT